MAHQLPVDLPPYRPTSPYHPTPSPVRGLLAWQRAHPQRYPQRAQCPRHTLSCLDNLIQARTGGGSGPRHLHGEGQSSG